MFSRRAKNTWFSEIELSKSLFCRGNPPKSGPHIPTPADAGVGVGLSRGVKNLIKKAINQPIRPLKNLEKQEKSMKRQEKNKKSPKLFCPITIG